MRLNKIVVGSCSDVGSICYFLFCFYIMLLSKSYSNDSWVFSARHLDVATVTRYCHGLYREGIMGSREGKRKERRKEGKIGVDRGGGSVGH